MRIPTIRGVIDRRILVNYRVDPHVLAEILPSPFRPQIVNGYGIAGICLIRLKHVRPRICPRFLGISSENAAHRIAVQWDHAGIPQTGVYIPRRDTSSSLNVIAGGRLFPGAYHLAQFDVREGRDQLNVAMQSRDRLVRIQVNAHVTTHLPGSSVFISLADVSEFFKSGAVGYSPQSSAGRFDGLEMRTRNWDVEPLTVDGIETSFFDDCTVFPSGAATFDSALLMRGIEHEWHSRETICDTDVCETPIC